jgi:ParB-like chromosome segregation protein Spo0J
MQKIIELITALDNPSVETINAIRAAVHAKSPFRDEPVDFVEWVPAESVYQNDYNPNSVAPPEMELLRVSIDADGYTQPIVTMPDADGKREVIDGFHRHRIGKEDPTIAARIKGYLPTVRINESRYDKADRMAATIRHNRARGKHRVDAMSDIVIELKRRNWSDNKIASNLGMEPDEVLRLCQISGLSELFADQEFSKSWDIEDASDDFVPLQDTDGEPVVLEPGRILHTWDQWECYRAGFYETAHDKTKDQCEAAYCELLRDIPAFEAALVRVVTEWTKSCEHYLTNERMNRIAWLGQASLCIAKGIPSIYRGGFNLLTPDEQNAANEAALRALNAWLVVNGRASLTMADAQSKTEANLY